MPGRLIYLMGPSGSGKDTILQGLCQLMGTRCYLAPRLITRPETSTERGSIAVSESEFVRLECAGALAMSWRANGLAYGVPEVINDRLAVGCNVLVNGSRGYLPEARRRYRTLVPVLLSVQEDALHQRLVARGRETEDQIRRRLNRNAQYIELAKSPSETGILVLDNSGAPEDAIQALHNFLRQTDTDTRYPYASDFTGDGECRTGSRL